MNQNNQLNNQHTNTANTLLTHCQHTTEQEQERPARTLEDEKTPNEEEKTPSERRRRRRGEPVGSTGPVRETLLDAREQKRCAREVRERCAREQCARGARVERGELSWSAARGQRRREPLERGWLPTPLERGGCPRDAQEVAPWARLPRTDRLLQ